MAEIDKTTQGTPSEEKAPPGGSEEITPKKEAKTHTETDVNKAVQAALTKAGRDDKALANQKAGLDARQEAIDAQQVEIDEAERQRDAAELAAAKGDPELLRVYQDKQDQKREVAGITTQKADIKKQREALDRDKAEHEGEITAARDTMMEIKVFEIATKYKVDPVALKNLNLPTVEQIEEVAKVMSKLPPKGEGEDEDTEPLTPDSAVTSGGQGEPTQEQLEKMSMGQYAAYVAKRDAKK